MVKDKLFNDAYLCQIKDKNTEKTTHMMAMYFDTPSLGLAGRKMAFRVRFEDKRAIATLKWNGTSDNGLHVRGELNIPVEETFHLQPNVEVFRESEIYEEIKRAVGSEDMVNIVDMDYVRREVKLDTGKSISVLSYDEGIISTASGQCPISEVEIELYSGDGDDMVSLGRQLECKYNLIPDDTSKLQKGLSLLKKQ